MNAELFIHGPRNAFYGTSSEVAYSKLFDNSNIKDEVRFIVEVRNSVDGNRYAYYTYCRYSNVQDYGGRNGAYIGLSIRLDSYYTNLRAMYTVLEAVFNKGVLGLLIDKTAFGFQYRVESFEPVKQKILENIERPLGSYLTNLYNPSEFVTIDSSFQRGQDLIKSIDDNKYTEERLRDIKSSGKLIFASSMTLDCILDVQKKFEKLLSEARDQHIQEVEKIQEEKDHAVDELRSKYEKSVADAQEQYESIASKCETAEQKLSSLEKSCSNMQDENKRLLSEKDMLVSKLERTSGNTGCIQQLKEEVTSLKMKVDYLEKENAELRGFNVHHSSNHNGDDRNDPHNFNNLLKDTVQLSLAWLCKHKSEFFFVIAIVLVIFAVVVLLNFRPSLINETHKTVEQPIYHCPAIDKSNVEAKIEAGTEMFPNEVSSSLYPNIGNSGETIQIENEQATLILSMLKYENNGAVEPSFQWEIKTPKGDRLREQGSYIRLTMNETGRYIFKVFVNQHLVGLKSFENLNHETH